MVFGAGKALSVVNVSRKEAHLTMRMRSAMGTKIDILGIGNAIMDVIAPVDETFLAKENISKGAMTLIDETRALHLSKRLETSSRKPQMIFGGSGANTIAGVAALDVATAYIGKVADDRLGAQFTGALRAEGVHVETPPLKTGVKTARCLIVVTPDGERSMNTFLGANTDFGPKDVDKTLVQNATVTYLEGYLFDTNAQKAAFLKAAEISKAAGRKVALTLSDPFCVDRHRASFQHIVDNHVDILFANHNELLSLYETNNLDDGVKRVWKTGITAAITLSEKGSLIIDNDKIYEIKAVPVGKTVDTTGAGDQYAAGVLAGRAMGLGWVDAGHLGSLCAAEVITHYGARPETRIHELACAQKTRL